MSNFCLYRGLAFSSRQVKRQSSSEVKPDARFRIVKPESVQHRQHVQLRLRHLRVRLRVRIEVELQSLQLKKGM